MKDKSRTRDLAILLPWLGAFLFMPPVLLLFRPTVNLLGVPLLPVYIFVMWFVLILASRKLTSHLVADDDHSDEINRDALLPGAPPSADRDEA